MDGHGSFFWGGFECSTHRRTDGTRLDLIAATAHDVWARDDYQRLAREGIRRARDGLRWHLIDQGRGTFDWSSAIPLVRAAEQAAVRVAWDLCHYGWPDDVDIWSPDFVTRFADFAVAAARLVRTLTGRSGWFCPVNEISYFAWAAGDAGHMAPAATGRSYALKCQLAAAGIAAARAMRADDPAVRFLWAEPAVQVLPGSDDPEAIAAAQGMHDAQFQAYDMLCGRLEPQLGGDRSLVDLLGINYYPHNQWHLGGGSIGLGHALYRPLHGLLCDYHARYGGPLMIAETGAEGCARAAWLHYVMGEVEQAQAAGVDVTGVCIYPIVDYPGWSNARPCPAGLFGFADAAGHRPVHDRLQRELHRQQRLLGEPPALASIGGSHHPGLPEQRHKKVVMQPATFGNRRG